ncbi:hypothetical protein C8J56DRAFT_796169, partial [Mycena floridula]
CWGYAKHTYHEYPESTKEEDLEQNLLKAVNSVPLDFMCRYSIRSLRFMDAYCKGLNRKQATWAAKKYQGHCTIPDSILAELSEADIPRMVPAAPPNT